MADTGYIDTVGDRLILQLDPNTGTFAGSLSFNAVVMAGIVLSASGGEVTVTRLHSPMWFPTIIESGARVEVELELSRPIKYGETVSLVSMDAGLVSDGTRNTKVVTGLALTNESLHHDSIAELCSPTTPIFYVDAANGDDTLAAAANGVGYYTTAQVGADPENPSITPQAYATPVAAWQAARGTTNGATAVLTHGVCLFRLGQDSVWESLGGNNRAFANTGGVIGGAPWVFGTYGSGADVNCLPGTGVTSYMIGTAGNRLNIVVSRGLKFPTTGPSTFEINTHSTQTAERLYARNCRLGFVNLKSADPNYLGSRRGFAFYECVVSVPPSIGVSVATPNLLYLFRDIRWRWCLFRDIGANSQDHPAYFKTVDGWDMEDCWATDCSGYFLKIDNNRNVHVKRVAVVNAAQLAGVETNGHAIFGEQTDRTESSPGGYSEKVLIEDSIVGSPNTTRSGILSSQGVDFACSSDVLLRNCLVLLQGGFAGNGNNGIELRRSAGSSDQINAREGFRWTFEECTVVGDAQVLLSVSIPTTDDFTQGGSKGYHDVLGQRNIFLLTGDPALGGHIIRFFADTWANGVAAGRVDGTFRWNCFWSLAGFTGAYEVDGTLFNDWATLQATLGSDWALNREENPGFSDPTYTPADYILSLGYASVPAWAAALEANVLAGTIPANESPKAIFNAVVSRYNPSNLSAANYGGVVAGAKTIGSLVTGPELAVTGGGSPIASGGAVSLGTTLDIGDDATIQLTLTNSGDSALTLGTLAASGDLSIEAGDNPSAATIAAGQTDTVTVRLATASAGAKSGVLTIPSDDAASPYTVTVTATVLAAADLAVEGPGGDLASGASLSLGSSVVVGGDAEVQLTIRNDGGSAIVLGTLAAGGDLTIDAGDNPSGATINGGQTDTVTVRLATASAGAKSGTLTIPSNDAGSPFTLNLTATVVTAAALAVRVADVAQASGSIIDAGDIEQNAAGSFSATLANTGGASLTIGTVTVSGSAATLSTNPSNATIAGGATAALVLDLPSADLGTFVAALSIPSDAAGSPWVGQIVWRVVTAPEPITGPDGPDVEQRYLSVAEADALIAVSLDSTDPFRLAWAVATDADKANALNTGTGDFDQVRWKGQPLVAGQAGAWPRMDRFGRVHLPGGEPSIPDSLDQTAWSFANLPREIRIGLAVQAAARLANAKGIDDTFAMIDRAASGVASVSGGGRSVTIDPVRASRPSSRLHPRVRTIVSRYIATSAEVV